MGLSLMISKKIGRKVHVGKTMLRGRKDNIVLCGIRDVRGQKCLLQK